MKLGIVGNTNKSRLWEVIPKFLNYLNDCSIRAIVHDEISQRIDLPHEIISVDSRELVNQSDVIVAFGGDGTILSTVRLVGMAGIPILGVNLGGLGFLAEVGLDELNDRVEDLIEDRYTLEERMILQAKSSRYQDTLYAMNDVVIDKSDSGRVISIETYIGDDYLNTYIADGLIVSTPTGSTAYSLSANGPILFPTMKAMIISPICPHALGARSLVIPENETIRITVYSDIERVLFTGDGQIIQWLKPGDKVEISKAKFTAKLLKFHDRDFYDLLRAKLNWGQRNILDDKKNRISTHKSIINSQVEI